MDCAIRQNDTRMTKDELQQRVSALRWYHTIDLGHGVVTPGVDDIGAWDGFFSFEAERRGAARVVASDFYAWHGEGWGSGQGKAGFELARRALGSRVEDVDVDVMDLSPDRVGLFDIVLFLGVLYHLPNPLLALERVAAVTRSLLVL